MHALSISHQHPGGADEDSLSNEQKRRIKPLAFAIKRIPSLIHGAESQGGPPFQGPQPHWAQWGEAIGGDGGNPFRLSATGHISKIRLWTGDCVDALQFHIDGSEWSKKYGGNGEKMQVLELKEEDDHICCVKVRHGEYPAPRYIQHITFECKSGQSLSGGGQGGRFSREKVGTGKLMDVRGRCGDLLDQLQFMGIFPLNFMLQRIGQFVPSFESVVQNMPMGEMLREKVIIRLIERNPDEDPLQIAMTRWPSTLDKVSAEKRLRMVQRNSGKNAGEWNNCFSTEFKRRIGRINAGAWALAQEIQFAGPSTVLPHEDDGPVFFINNATKFFTVPQEGLHEKFVKRWSSTSSHFKVETVVIKSTSCECDPDIVVEVQKEADSRAGFGGSKMWIRIEGGPLIDDIGRQDDFRGAERY